MAPKRRASNNKSDENASKGVDELPPTLSWYKTLSDGVEHVITECAALVGDNPKFDPQAMKMNLFLPLVEAKQNFLTLHNKVEQYKRAWTMVAVGFQAVKDLDNFEPNSSAVVAAAAAAAGSPAAPTQKPPQSLGSAAVKPKANGDKVQPVIHEEEAPETMHEPSAPPPRKTRQSSQPVPTPTAAIRSPVPQTKIPFDRNTAPIIVGETKVEREFVGFGKFAGTVGNKKKSLYRILYEDGDTEDFTEEEVRRFMMPPDDNSKEPKKKKARLSAGKAKSAPKPRAPAPAPIPKVDHAHNTRHANSKPATKVEKPASASTTPNQKTKAKASTAQKPKAVNTQAYDKLTLEALEENPFLAVGVTYEEKFPGAGWYKGQVIEVIGNKEKAPLLLVHYDDDTDGRKPLKTFVKKIEDYKKKLIVDAAARRKSL